jgi:hypothetical protein
VYTLVFNDAHRSTVFLAGEAGSSAGSLEQRFAAWGFSMVVTGGLVEPEMRLVFRVRNPEAVIARLRQSLSLSGVKDTSFLQLTAVAPDPPWARQLI